MTASGPARSLDRRSFLRTGAAAVGAVVAGATLLDGCTTTGAPPAAPTTSPAGASAAGTSSRSATAAALSATPDNALVQPALRSSADGVLDTTLRVAEADVTMGGTTLRAVSYEAGFPGPTLEVHAGDTLKVALKNDSAQPTNLHTHGLHVSPKGNSDNVFVTVAPGTTFDYQYTLPADHAGGTNWYHAHYHEYADNQVSGGQFGLLVVRGAFDDLPGIAGLEEQVLLIAQTEIKDGKMVEADDSSLANQITVVNGSYQPVIEIEPGQTQRWRIVNVNPTFYRLQLDGQPMHVVAYDGNALTEPRRVDVLELGPGMRADVLVQGGPPGSTELRSLSFDQLGPFWTANMVPVPQSVVRVVSRGNATRSAAALPTALLPMKDLRTVAIDRTRTFRLEEREPRHTGRYDQYHYFINGSTFDHDVVNETMHLGATEEWVFENRTYEPHPLHIHVNPFQVVAVNGVPADENHYRDTAVIPPFGSLTIRHQFLDFTGKFVMHCHILFHEDHGMMQTLEVID